MHADKEAALRTVAARPLLDEAVDGFRSAQIEGAYAEVGSVGDLERVPQRWQEVGGDIVKDAGHFGVVGGGASWEACWGKVGGGGPEGTPCQPTVLCKCRP